MERVYKKQLIETLKLARAEVKKPFGWVKGAYQSALVLREPNEAEVGHSDRRGVVINAGEKGLYTSPDLSRFIEVPREEVNCVCAVGAVQKAIGRDCFGAKANLLKRTLDELTRSLPKRYLKSEKCGGQPAVEEFNDLPDTTQGQVVAVFTRAIKRLEGGV